MKFEEQSCLEDFDSEVQASIDLYVDAVIEEEQERRAEQRESDKLASHSYSITEKEVHET